MRGCNQILSLLDPFEVHFQLSVLYSQYFDSFVRCTFLEFRFLVLYLSWISVLRFILFPFLKYAQNHYTDNISHYNFKMLFGLSKCLLFYNVKSCQNPTTEKCGCKEHAIICNFFYHKLSWQAVQSISERMLKVVGMNSVKWKRQWFLVAQQIHNWCTLRLKNNLVLCRNDNCIFHKYRSLQAN